MARIELEITGNATGLENASKKAATAVGGLTKSTAMSKAQIEAWDAAARRNTMEQYGQQVKRTTASVNGLASAQRNLSGSTSSLATNIKGANTVGIEFSRIIQDAPYGIIGVGNNITQLTQNFANLRTQTGSTSQALGIAFRSMFSGANLLVLGVSAVTTAFTFYNMWARKNKKDTDDLTDGTKRYIDTLEGVVRTHAEGIVNAQKEVTGLRLLYEATQNLTLPMESRRKAADEIIRQYPKQFEGLNTETILVGKASEAYKDLNATLVATATAMANLERIRENANNILDKRLLIQQKENEAAEKAREIQKQQRILDAERAAGSSGQYSELRILKLQGERNALLEEAKNLGGEIASLTRESNKLQGDYNNQIANGADLSGKISGNIKKTADDTNKALKLQETLDKLRQESIQASLSGYEKELQASQHRYDELKQQADEYYRQGKVSAKEYADYIARLQGFRVGEAGRIIQGAGSMSVPLGQGRPSTQGVVQVQLPNQVANVDTSMRQSWNEFVDDLDKQLSRAVQSFGRDFLRTLTTINQQVGVTVDGVVSGIIGSLTGGITEVLSTVFTKQLSESIQNGFLEGKGGLGKVGTYGAAGAAILGSIISGATKRTYVGEQALGGALAGAGTGAAIGSVIPVIGTAIGAIGGAIIGALGGIFGASSAKKQEKQQQEMLAEQRKQTALLERQNALTYASSIIGQMTSGGIVTGVMRDAFGQLVATVKGSDLQFVLQRAGGSR